MLTTRNEKPASPSNNMLAALRWVDKRLELPERRAVYAQCPSFERAMFSHDDDKQFQIGDGLRTDVGMARFFASKAMIGEDKKFDPTAWDELTNSGFSVNSIVCVGDDVASWVIVGKHFYLEVRNQKFD